MHPLQQLMTSMRQEPLALLERTRTALWALAAREARGEAIPRVEVAAALELTADRAPRPAGGGVAVIPVLGLILQRKPAWADEYGIPMTGTEELLGQVRAAVAEPAVRTIVLDIESPGGFIYGVPEAADEIRALREQKKIVAVANSYAASAAYWLAASASEIVVTPSGEVGSIGVYAVHEDWSEFYAKIGIKPTQISAGKYKTEFSDLAPLSDEGREELQRRVDETYGTFLKAVAAGRGVSASAVRDGFGQGRMVRAKAAVEAGMADRVATLQAVLMKLTGRGGTAGARAVAPDPDLELRQRRTRLAARS